MDVLEQVRSRIFEAQIGPVTVTAQIVLEDRGGMWRGQFVAGNITTIQFDESLEPERD